MYIASKLEEIYAPKLGDFVKAADSGYDIAEVKRFEGKMLLCLGWRFLPATSNAWINWLMQE